MSPNTPNDFIGSLVEMAEAYRELPKVQAELSDARGELFKSREDVASREVHIIKLKAEIEQLQSTVRSLEVERDDAQFHALEADDRTQRALDFIKATFGNAGTLIQALEPPRATPAQPMDTPSAMTMPVNDPEPEGLHTTQPVGQSEPLPSASADTAPQNVNTEQSDAFSSATSPASEVASAHPTPTDATSTEVSDAKPHATASHETEPFSIQPRQPGKYDGLTYSAAHQHYGLAFSWPSKDEWLSDGGTLDNFYA